MSQAVMTPRRGFTPDELETRTLKLQRRMHQRGIDAVFVCTEPEFRYFSGFKSQFWESPTRPWFLVIPAEGKPIAVVPEIGAAGLRQTWIEDVRSWPSPRPEDDGVSLLASALRDCGRRHGCLGTLLGPETHLRMPAQNFVVLQDQMSGYQWVDVSSDIQSLRSVKSDAEVAKVRFACEVAATGFDHLLDHLAMGMTEREACKAMHIKMLEAGADACPYLISASGPGGYDNIIMGPTDRVLGDGDVLIIDTGACFDGYFSDFDRNWGFGAVDDKAHRAYDALNRATEAGLAFARPGETLGDLWQSMWSVLESAGALGNDVGRMGHGLGMQLTEWPSIVPNSEVRMEAGMVLTLEPGMAYGPGQMMVHEDNILITEEGCEMLHSRALPRLPVIE